ncbi:hypothetical protein FHG87_004531 [Trinorchestia longiramus]|nr:hypothetical protein FHG87_004531 [Trinorchestia longiramus]
MGPDSVSQQQWRHQVTKTVTWVFLLLLVLSVPHIVVHALHERGYAIPIPWLLVHVLFFGRYVVDPAIFVLSSSEYRQAFAEALVLLVPCFAGRLGRPSEGAMAPPCTPASAPRHKVIDLSVLDLTTLKVSSKESNKTNNTQIKIRFA